ncbi:hypothetical protein ACJX0J_030934 [Zea mays]
MGLAQGDGPRKKKRRTTKEYVKRIVDEVAHHQNLESMKRLMNFLICILISYSMSGYYLYHNSIFLYISIGFCDGIGINCLYSHYLYYNKELQASVCGKCLLYRAQTDEHKHALVQIHYFSFTTLLIVFALHKISTTKLVKQSLVSS